MKCKHAACYTLHTIALPKRPTWPKKSPSKSLNVQYMRQRGEHLHLFDFLSVIGATICPLGWTVHFATAYRVVERWLSHLRRQKGRKVRELGFLYTHTRAMAHNVADGEKFKPKFKEREKRIGGCSIAAHKRRKYYCSCCIYNRVVRKIKKMVTIFLDSLTCLYCKMNYFVWQDICIMSKNQCWHHCVTEKIQLRSTTTFLRK